MLRPQHAVFHAIIGVAPLKQRPEPRMIQERSAVFHAVIGVAPLKHQTRPEITLAAGSSTPSSAWPH